MSNETFPPSLTPETPAETSLASRLTNVFVAPGEVFTEVKVSPVRHSNWIVSAIIYILLSWCAAGVMLSSESLKHSMTEMQEQAMQKKFQKLIDEKKMTQAQADQAKDTATKFAAVIYTIAAFIGPLIGAAIGPFLGGFILWTVGNLVFRQPFSYLKGVEASGLTMVVAGLGVLVKGLLCTALGTMYATPGFVLLVRPYDPANLLHTFLLTFDLFVIWGTVLSGIALAKLSAVSFVKAFAWMAAITVILVGGMVTLGWAVQQLAPK